MTSYFATLYRMVYNNILSKFPVFSAKSASILAKIALDGKQLMHLNKAQNLSRLFK